jgi:hypothetical protein
MLKDADRILEGFQDTVRKSLEECGDELEETRQLLHAFLYDFFKTINEYHKSNPKSIPKYMHSLVFTCFLELVRISGHIFFLSCNGLYRNAFNDIRYALESIVQALYIDFRHPEVNIGTKIEILKEVEDKREYHAIRLIDDLEIDFKGELRKEYKNLSRIIHPSHKQIVRTIKDLKEDTGVPVTIDCEEIPKIRDSTKRMYDVFFFLFINYFQDFKEVLKKNENFLEKVRIHKLYLLPKILNV